MDLYYVWFWVMKKKIIKTIAGPISLSQCFEITNKSLIIFHQYFLTNETLKVNFKRCDFMSFISLSSQWRRTPMGFLNQTEVCWKNGCRNRSTCTNNKSNCCLLQNIDLEPGERSNRASIRFQYELWWDCQTWREKLENETFWLIFQTLWSTWVPYHDFVPKFVMFFSATLMQPECGPQSTDSVAWWSTQQRSPEQIPMKAAIKTSSLLMARTLDTEDGKLFLHASCASLDSWSALLIKATFSSNDFLNDASVGVVGIFVG